MVGLVQLGGSSTGRTQGWEMSVNSALCCWNVSTLRFLIIQALIKDFGRNLCFSPGIRGSAAPAVPPARAHTAVELLHFLTHSHNLILTWSCSPALWP